MNKKLAITAVLAIVLGTLGYFKKDEKANEPAQEVSEEPVLNKAKPQEIVNQESKVRFEISVFGDMQNKNHPNKCKQIEKIISLCQEINNKGCEFNFKRINVSQCGAKYEDLAQVNPTGQVKVKEGNSQVTEEQRQKYLDKNPEMKKNFEAMKAQRERLQNAFKSGDVKAQCKEARSMQNLCSDKKLSGCVANLERTIQRVCQ